MKYCLNSKTRPDYVEKSGPLVEKVDLLEARGGSYEPLEPPLRTPMG